MSEVKELFVFLGAVVLVAVTVASCSIIERKQHTEVMRACFERVEDVSECVWFDRNAGR